MSFYRNHTEIAKITILRHKWSFHIKKPSIFNTSTEGGTNIENQGKSFEKSDENIENQAKSKKHDSETLLVISLEKTICFQYFWRGGQKLRKLRKTTTFYLNHTQIPKIAILRHPGSFHLKKPSVFNTFPGGVANMENEGKSPKSVPYNRAVGAIQSGLFT